MIKLKSIYIEEFRGIKRLLLRFGEGNFAITGPNGSGKSGIIDAIEFALTGKISRLQGAGTSGVTVLRHGPHVDKSQSPEQAFVRLEILFPLLKKTATITRKIKAPRNPIICPNDDDILSVINDFEHHSEIVLSRRDLLRLIFTEPKKRSEQIQALLKLDRLDQMRSKLRTVQNKLEKECSDVERQVKSSTLQLQRHLGIDQLTSKKLLTAVNDRRELLTLQAIRGLDPTTRVDVGISEELKSRQVDKLSARREIKYMVEELESFPQKVESTIQNMLKNIRSLQENSLGSNEFKRLSLVESGLEILDSALCPLCDVNWPDESELRSYLEAKYRSLNQSKKLRQSFRKDASFLRNKIANIWASLASIRQLAIRLNRVEIASALENWVSELKQCEKDLDDFSKICQIKDLCANHFLLFTQERRRILERLSRQVDALVDKSDSHKAHTFLVVAQEKLMEYRRAKRQHLSAKHTFETANSCYQKYCEVLESVLNSLYREVEQDFRSYYRKLNIDDEFNFEATLEPQLSQGKVMLDVAFYGRGKFPPTAYHSEGHQDAMGVCLYLALMKRLFGERFSLALLDDVVMSIDAGHRKRFCDLLKTEFPGTQFVITTHDLLWMEQMRFAGLVTLKRSIRFYDWTVDRGPLIVSSEGIWEEIEEALLKDSVSRAAAALRHHLEFVFRELADELGASVRFRNDGRYDLGDLLPNVLSRVMSLYNKAKSAAHSWKHHETVRQISDRIESLSNLIAESRAEQWAINSAVHYNSWANFSKEDFSSVVTSFRRLSECLRCGKCGSWFRISPRINPNILHCNCGDTNFTLNEASKQTKK